MIPEEFVSFGTITVGDVTHPDVSQRKDFSARLAESQLGTKRPIIPSYIYNGSVDTIVPPSGGRELYSSWCQFKGVSVVYTQAPAQEHASNLVAGTPQAVAWLSARLAGKPAEPGCHENQQLPGIG